MSAHTPGEWRIAVSGPNGCPVIGAGPLMVAMLAHTVNQPEQKAEAEANACLIAAAPNLLSALCAIVRSLAEQDEEGMIEHAQQMIDARAAIAKATGAALSAGETKGEA